MPQNRHKERGSSLEPEQRDFIEEKLREEKLSIKAMAAKYKIAESTFRNALNGKNQDDLTRYDIIDRLGVPDVDQLKERSRRLFHIPRERNPYFTGREDTMKALCQELEESRFAAVTQALSGLGGMGKTSTAIEYAYRCRDKANFADYPRYKAIQFVRADTVESLKNGYVRIANALQLRRADLQNPEEAVQAVLRWMMQPEDTPWLLILDNVDDPDLLEKFLPSGSQRHCGHILITSRSYRFANRIKRVDIQEMKEEEGVRFLYRRTERERIAGSKEEQAARALVSEMGGLPLALEQAAAYMTCKVVMSFEDYLTNFRDQRERSKLMMHAPEYGFYRRFEPKTRKYTEALTILTTWHMSLASIEPRCPNAVRLLRLCAFLHPVGIPRELVVALLPDYFAPAAEDKLKQNELYNSLLNVLMDHSLIQCDLNNATHSVHILVQTVLRDGMRPEEQKRAYERILTAIAASFPSDDYVLLGRSALYYPHAERLRAYVEQTGREDEAVGRLLNRIGFHLYNQGRLAEAEPLLDRALALQQKILSEDHPDIAASLNCLGRLRWSQGRFAEAEPLFEKAIEIWRKAFPNGCPGRAQSLNNLAELYCSMGRGAEAEPLYKQALALREKVLPKGHPDIANSFNNLAGLYHGQGDMAQAEPLYRQALALRQEALPGDHPDIANSFNNLGKLYHDQKRYAEAEPLFLQAAAIWRKACLEDHHLIAFSCNNLAELYRGQKRFSEAEPLYEEAIEIWRKTLPEDHPFLAVSLNNFAGWYQDQGRFTEAQPLYEQALAIRQRVLPNDHPHLAKSLGNLAELHRCRGRFAEAAPLYEKAAGILLFRFGKEHPDYQAVLANYRRCLAQIKKEEQAACMAPDLPA